MSLIFLKRSLLLLSHFSRVRLCVTPSLGFSRQEHWSGLPFPSPMHKSEKWKWSRSVMSDSSRPHGLQPTRLLRPWDFPGKSTGVGCHCLLQKRSLVFPILLFSSISSHWSLRKAFLSLLGILRNSSFRWVYLSFSSLPFASLLFSAIYKAFSDNHFALLHFFFLGMVLIPTSCTMLQTSIHSSSGTLYITYVVGLSFNVLLSSIEFKHHTRKMFPLWDIAGPGRVWPDSK